MRKTSSRGEEYYASHLKLNKAVSGRINKTQVKPPKVNIRPSFSSYNLGTYIKAPEADPSDELSSDSKSSKNNRDENVVNKSLAVRNGDRAFFDINKPSETGMPTKPLVVSNEDFTKQSPLL